MYHLPLRLPKGVQGKHRHDPPKVVPYPEQILCGLVTLISSQVEVGAHLKELL